MERVCWTNKKKSYFKMSLWALGYVMSIFHCLNDYLMYGLMFDMPSGMIKLILCNVDFFFAFCWQMSYLSCLSVRWCIWCLWCQLIWLVYSSSWDCVFLYFSIFLCVLLCGWVCVVGEEQKGLAALCFIYLDRSHLFPWASDGLCCVCCLNPSQGWNINI